MNFLNAFLLGLTQGLTEFLPVSSSGHLIFFERLLNVETSLFFNVLLHAGSLLSVFVVFRKQIWELIKHPFSKTMGYLVVATIPTVCIALLFKKFAPDVLNGSFLALGFMATCFLLTLTKIFANNQNRCLDVKNATLTGVLQGIAVLPGLSRSGSTMTALMLCGVEKETAFNFSFLLSIPIIIGSLILESVEMTQSSMLAQQEIGPCCLGVFVAFLSGIFALVLFKNIVKKHSFLPFAFYTFVMSILTLLIEFKII